MSETAAFDELAREFFSVWFRFHPDAALQSGIDEFDALLPCLSDDEQAALGNWLETLVVALEEFDYGSLDPARRLDLELMFALARVEHRELQERHWRHRDPLRFLPLALIHQLTLLRPVDMRDALWALLEAIPGHLRLAITQLRPTAALVPSVLVQAAIEAADDGRRYLRALTRSRWFRAHCPGCRTFENQAEIVGEALRQYAAALGSEIEPSAAAAAGCGPEHLRFLLRHRHQLDVDPTSCAGLLDGLAKQCDERLAALPAESVSRQATLNDAVMHDLLRTECQAAAERLEREIGLRLPPEPLRIAGGPVCPRVDHGRVDYMADLVKGEGVLYVPDGDARCHADLGVAEMRLRCIRLGWGGRHSFAFAGGMAARSLPRRLAAADTLRRGWALHLERRLFDACDDLTEQRAALRLRGQAIATARADLALHCERIDTATAGEWLRQAGVVEADVLQRVADIVRFPGDALAGVLGWQLIEAAASVDGDRDAGPAASVRPPLHDLLFNCGPIPLPLAMREGMGEAAWNAVLQASGIGDARADLGVLADAGSGAMPN